MSENLTVHEAPGGSIYEGDCLNALEDMGDESVDLAFTSPPYFDAINYEGHVEKLRGDKDWWEREEVSYEEYEKFLKERFKALLDVLKPNGYNIVNLSPVISDNGRVPLPFHFVDWMEEIGWEFEKNIIWEKTVAVDRRSGVLMQHPYPGYYYPSIVSECILVFRKPSGKNPRESVDCDDHWEIRPVAPNEVEHPAPFPKELPEKIINTFTEEGDAVIDIFGGSGQTYLAASENQREFIGCEVLEEYVEYSLERLQEQEHQKTLDDI